VTAAFPPWPALNADAAPTGGLLQYGRAVRGKVHRAASDYRWIAATPGLDPQGLQMLKAITFGLEDRPVDLVAWAALDSGYLAVHAYPSRARDAAGRAGGLEKQVAYWTPGSLGVPPAAAAFFLLEAAQKFDDAVWWSTWEMPDWGRAAFVLELGRGASLPIPWDAARLRARIERGIAELRSAVDEDALARFYQAILDGRRPAFLKVSAGSVSPAALAALLLPLPAAMARTVSLAGGLPLAEARPELLENWAGIACGAAVRDNGPAPGEQARGWARALLAGNPGALPSAAQPVAESPAATAPGATAPGETTPAETTPRETAPAARYLSNFLVSDERNLADPEPAAGWAPIPGADLEALIGQVRQLDKESGNSGRFARDPERRRALQAHLRLKGDLARAWLYAHAPGNAVLHELPPRDDARAPALWFAPVVPRSAQSWKQYSPPDFARLVVHSLAPERRQRRVVEWLESCRDSGLLDERLTRLLYESSR
jgi:hypothetical protein